MSRGVRLALVAMAAVAALSSACAKKPSLTGGDPQNGRLLLRQFGCGECHHIPGVAAAEGKRAPSLASVGRRIYLAGAVPNTPDNMARWIRKPHQLDPDTAMPDLKVTEAHARDMVAYLWTLD